MQLKTKEKVGALCTLALTFGVIGGSISFANNLAEQNRESDTADMLFKHYDEAMNEYPEDHKIFDEARTVLAVAYNDKASCDVLPEAMKNVCQYTRIMNEHFGSDFRNRYLPQDKSVVAGSIALSDGRLMGYYEYEAEQSAKFHTEKAARKSERQAPACDHL